MTTASASGKAILFGEHAVVYGRPAIAVPVGEARAWASVTEARAGSGCSIAATDLDRCIRLSEVPDDDPLALPARLALNELRIVAEPDWTITVRSDLPIAGGLGSGAAVATAIVRAVAMHAGQELPPHVVSRLVHATERVHHGTPSGIDSTVIAFERPIYFVRDQEPGLLSVGAQFWLAIADSGISSPTRVAVMKVREAWHGQRARYETLFDDIGHVVESAREAIESGQAVRLGPLMDANQRLLSDMGVSSPQLERLCMAARQGGASGAKLSGAGLGGNVIALLTPETVESVACAMRNAGAVSVIISRVGKTREQRP